MIIIFLIVGNSLTWNKAYPKVTIKVPHLKLYVHYWESASLGIPKPECFKIKNLKSVSTPKIVWINPLRLQIVEK